jgi:hypothetical protein
METGREARATFVQGSNSLSFLKGERALLKNEIRAVPIL